jgi:uncharacterized protein (DUF1800 family)
MKGLALATRAIALFALGSICLGIGSGRFDQKLSNENQAVHVLNRLTFGPRPGDAAQIQRQGIQKWIDQQLHPEQITENPALESKLEPLQTLHLQTWQIIEKYPQVRLPVMARQALISMAPQQLGRLRNASVDERRKALESMDAETRRSTLAALPDRLLDGLPEEMRKEAAEARQAKLQELRKELRGMPMRDLLTRDEMQTMRMGTKEQKRSLLDSFDPAKRQQVFRSLGLQALQELGLRREAMAAVQPQQLANADLIENKLYRAVYSNRQLEEVLVDFWMNHFNVFNGKGPVRTLLTSYERDAIRPHVLGRFKDLVVHTARHPAMLFYLDNWQSQVPRDDRPIPSGARRAGLNENYARELMELHTMGVDGGYTQEDVINVARAFSGWSIYEPNRYGEFQFNPGGHDRKEKIVLGRTLPAGRGEQDGLDVIDILVGHPSTAKFISRKLAQRFVADDPPQQLVDRMAITFTKTEGDLRAVLRTMFSSTEFLSEGAWRSKLKSPLELAVSVVRALNSDVRDAYMLAQRIAELGQPLYGKAEPTGYPNTNDAWVNTAGMLGRFNFATALTGGEISGIQTDFSRFDFNDPAAVATQLLVSRPASSTLAAIEKGIKDGEASPYLVAALVLGSPDFQRR